MLEYTKEAQLEQLIKLQRKLRDSRGREKSTHTLIEKNFEK